MQNQNTKINFLVGLFVLGGIVALLFLALQAANLSSFSTSKGYEEINFCILILHD